MQRFLVKAVALGIVWLMTERSSAGEFDDPRNVKPGYIASLENSFGGPGQSGFGSAVFMSSSSNRIELEAQALEKYRYFVGALWEKGGEAGWIANYRLMYHREGVGDIVTELLNLPDDQGNSSAHLMLDGTQDPVSAKAAVISAFDDPTVEDLLVFSIGDGAAMSGLLIAARRRNGEATFLITLMD